MLYPRKLMKLKLIFLYTLLFLVCRECNTTENKSEFKLEDEDEKNQTLSDALKELDKCQEKNQIKQTISGLAYFSSMPKTKQNFFLNKKEVFVDIGVWHGINDRAEFKYRKK